MKPLTHPEWDSSNVKTDSRENIWGGLFRGSLLLHNPVMDERQEEAAEDGSHSQAWLG